MQRVKHTLRFIVKDGCRVSGYFDIMKTLPERVQEAVKEAKARGYSVQKIADEIGLSQEEKTLIQAFNIADKSVREMFLVMARAELGKIKMNAA